MKVLGIVAGPRKTGHTATLVEETMEGAKEAGHETVLYYLSDYEIKPLEAGKDGYVYPEDGFQELMPHIFSLIPTLSPITPTQFSEGRRGARIYSKTIYFHSDIA